MKKGVQRNQFRFFTETASFGVSIEPKQKRPTKTQIVDNYVTYNLSKVQIVSIKIEA